MYGSNVATSDGVRAPTMPSRVRVRVSLVLFQPSAHLPVPVAAASRCSCDSSELSPLPARLQDRLAAWLGGFGRASGDARRQRGELAAIARCPFDDLCACLCGGRSNGLAVADGYLRRGCPPPAGSILAWQVGCSHGARGSQLCGHRDGRQWQRRHLRERQREHRKRAP